MKSIHNKMNVSSKTKKVFVGLSGGVDSSVSALLLKEAGYDVTGVFIKVWHPDFLECDWETERLDAMRVAATLDIPFLTFDAEKIYKAEVADYMIQEYREGRTPNPDVMCNSKVKFGAFLDFARAEGAEYVATGHYAQNILSAGVHTLRRGLDTTKDQSYFLWTLSQNELQHVLFPIGDLQKTEVRKIAEQNNLLTAQKKDSQGICFLGQIDLQEFLSHFIEHTPGDVLNTEGKIIGTHNGSLLYTLGQRHGFTLTQKDDNQTPQYIHAKDLKKNTLTVGPEKPILEKGTLALARTNWIADTPTAQETIEVQTRYRQAPISATILDSQPDAVSLHTTQTTDIPAIGQSCVLYREDICVGGGIIQSVNII